MKRVASLAVAALAVACSEPERDLLYRPWDAGPDAREAGIQADAGDPELGKPCVDDAQCDDGIPCTFDSCDPKEARCRNHADDTLCDDGVFCNGRELCFQKTGCAAGAVVTCADGNAACVINRCVEATKSCAHEPRDADQDGDPDDHCQGGKDCNDLDPAISSLHSEVCKNGKDDDCDGTVDEGDCVAAANATCQTAMTIGAPGNYALSTVGAGKSFQTTCSVSKPQSAHDVVALVKVPSGPHVDLDLWVASGNGTEVSVAVQAVCGQSPSELACGSGVGASQTRARARDLAPGTYAVIVTGQTEASVALAVDFLAPTPKPTNEDCATAEPITPGVPMTVSLIDPRKDLPSDCKATTGERTYALTLTQTADVRVYASRLRGSGEPVLGLRLPSCVGQSDERDCHAGSGLPLFARALPPATYVLTVAATTPIDASVLVQLSAPTTEPADQRCTGAPPLTLGKTLAFDLADHEDAVKDGCNAGAPTAAYAFDLTAPSDVLAVARYPQTDVGSVAVDAAGCTPSDNRLCAISSTPVRSSKRNLAAGSYRAVVADSQAAKGTLTVFSRPTVAAVNVVGAHDCTSPQTIAATGGFFTGDTTLLSGLYDESCDQGGQPKGGAPEHVFRLDLTKPSRVVLSTEGSLYSTILSVRKGVACPGVELQNGCTAGYSASRSFLDFANLSAGTYWVFVDGFVGQKGVYNLDVYVTDP